MFSSIPAAHDARTGCWCLHGGGSPRSAPHQLPDCEALVQHGFPVPWYWPCPWDPGSSPPELPSLPTRVQWCRGHWLHVEVLLYPGPHLVLRASRTLLGPLGWGSYSSPSNSWVPSRSLLPC